MSEQAAETEQRALKRARFIDRAVAFGVDYFSLLLLAYVVLYVMARAAGPETALSNFFLLGWIFLWLTGFLGYQTYFTAEGRQSPGKRLLGVQVYTLEGYPVPTGKAALRAACYLVSSFLFGLGFLWALFDGKKQGWHDKIAGTMVLETREKSALATVGIVAAFFAFASAAFGLFLWPGAAPHYHAMETEGHAREMLEALAQFEEAYKAKNGTYTTDVFELGKYYGTRQAFDAGLQATLDVNTLSIEAGKDSFRITAAPHGMPEDLLQVTGPPKE